MYKTQSEDTQSSSEKHTFITELIFGFKAALLTFFIAYIVITCILSGLAVYLGLSIYKAPIVAFFMTFGLLCSNGFIALLQS